MARSGTPQHYSGTATTTMLPQALVRKLGQRIIIRNLDGTNGLNVCLTRSGKVFYTIPFGQALDIECSFQQFYVQSTASTVAWCAITIEG